MSIKITIPNTSSDTLTFGSGNTPTAAQIAGIDSGSSNGQLALYTTASGTSTERVRVDASGNVGIGTTSPSSYTSGDQLVIASASGNGQMTLAGADAGNPTINFRRVSAPSTTRGFIQYDNTSDWLRFATNGSERARIDSSGNLLVGTTSSQTNASGITTVGANANSYQCVAQNTSGTSGSSVYKAQLSNASATTSSYFFFYATNGAGSTYSLRADGSSTFSSDQTLKKNIVDSRGYLEDLMKLRPVKYHWKTQEDSDPEKWLGLIAQEVEQVFPALVCEDKAEEGETPTKAVKYSVLPMMMLKAIQEQQALITQLQADVAALKGTK
jgi:hypothetical protein